MPKGYECGPCRLSPPSFDRLVPLLEYRPPVDAVMAAFKFERVRFLGDHLAQEMAQRLAPKLSEADCVVPVPLHWRRRWARGFDQAWLIAEELARRLDRPLVRGLRRRRATRPQTSLPRKERLRGPKGAFRGRLLARLRGQAVLLVDDVATTGATLEAAARELKRCGVSRVVAVVAARTPHPSER